MSIWDKVDQAEVEETKSFQTVPEGDYTAEVTDIEVKEDIFQTSVSIEYTITDGEFKGRKLWYNTSLSEEIFQKSPKRISLFKQQICKIAGVSSTSGDPLGVLTGAKGNIVSVYVKHNKSGDKTYVNVYCNGKLDSVPF